MTKPRELLVEKVVDEYMQANARSRRLYQSDPRFHATVEGLRETLRVFAEELGREGLPGWRVLSVVGSTLEHLLRDHLATHEAAFGDALTRKGGDGT